MTVDFKLDAPVRYAIYSLSKEQFISVWQSKSMNHEWTNDLHKVRSYAKLDEALKLSGDNPDRVVVKLMFEIHTEHMLKPEQRKEIFEEHEVRYRELYMLVDMTAKQEAELRKARDKMRRINAHKFDAVQSELRLATKNVVFKR